MHKGTHTRLSKMHGIAGRSAGTTVHVSLSFTYSALVGWDVHRFEFTSRLCYLVYLQLLQVRVKKPHKLTARKRESRKHWCKLNGSLRSISLALEMYSHLLKCTFYTRLFFIELKWKKGILFFTTFPSFILLSRPFAKLLIKIIFCSLTKLLSVKSFYISELSCDIWNAF